MRGGKIQEEEEYVGEDGYRLVHFIQPNTGYNLQMKSTLKTVKLGYLLSMQIKWFWINMWKLHDQGKHIARMITQ